MRFLAPWALLWLASVPVLLWLWRISSSRKRVRVPSLIPFERLARKAPTRRSRLVVNLLFWLQLGCLLFLVASLTRPVITRPRAKMVLAVIDTSASLGAGRAFDQAKRALLARVQRKGPADQWLIVATAPLAPLTPQPTSDGTALTQAVQRLSVAHLGGNLSTAAHVGRVLMGAEPDELVVVTDEKRPELVTPEGAATPVDWVTVGDAGYAAGTMNTAIVGLDAQGPLCAASDTGLVVTVQNFSPRAMMTFLTAEQNGKQLSGERLTLTAWQRSSVPIRLPEGARGLTELSLEGPGDQLAVDNKAWVALEPAPTLPVVVRSASPAFISTVSGWLNACPSLTWSVEEAPASGPFVVITDQADVLPSGAAAALVFSPAETAKPLTSYWLASSGHPIGSYLSPVGVVGAALDVSGGPVTGTVVVSALVAGRQVPVVIAEEREGRRLVTMRLSPSPDRPSTAVLLSVFNSLRWLMGREQVVTVGESMLVPGFAPGTVSVRLPNGATQTVTTRTGIATYDDTTLAGMYRFRQGSEQRLVPVNFIDPLESNLTGRPSTWHAAKIFTPISATPRPVAHPLANLFTWLVLALLLLEWWRYCAQSQRNAVPFSMLPPSSGASPLRGQAPVTVRNVQ